MSDENHDLRREVALFRFRLLGPLVHLPAGSDELAAGLRQLAASEHEIPGSSRRRVALSTLRQWLRAYRRDGFEGLYPRRRDDRSQSRSLPPEVAELLTGIKEREPRLTVKAVIRQARDSGRIPDGVRLAHSTVNRLLKQAGLMERPAPDARDRRRYAFEFANEAWQSDVLHGPRIAAAQAGRRQAKVYLIGILDDATRVVPHAAFAYSESVESFLAVFRQALLKRGTPQRLYVDNGANYRSKHLAVICAQLGTALIHARPYKPQGKGKIERFFRRVRAEFLPLIGPGEQAGLAALNRRLWAWIEGDYHHAPHRGLDGDTPLDRWARVGCNVRYAEPGIDLRRAFCYRLARRVSRARTVSVQGRLYETDAALSDQKVVLLQDPAARPEQPLIVLHENREAGRATLLDLHANARVRRSTSPGTGPDEPPAEPLALRQLDPEEPA